MPSRITKPGFDVDQYPHEVSVGVFDEGYDSDEDEDARLAGITIRLKGHLLTVTVGSHPAGIDGPHVEKTISVALRKKR